VTVHVDVAGGGQDGVKVIMEGQEDPEGAAVGNWDELSIGTEVIIEAELGNELLQVLQSAVCGRNS
jgi:hypothetical protein